MQQVKASRKSAKITVQKVSGIGDAAIWSTEPAVMAHLLPHGSFTVLKGDHILDVEIEHSEPQDQKAWAESIVRKIIQNCE